MLLDLDHFKYVNDTLGHSAGDELIVRGRRRAARARRATATVIARLGGDEFAVLLPDGDAGGREAIAERAARRRSASVAHRQPVGPAAHVSASIGVAAFDDARLTGEDVLVNADLAMYEAKEAGRDRVALHAPREDAPGAARSAAVVDRRASATRSTRTGFVLHAQPIIDLATGDDRASTSCCCGCATRSAS